MKNTYHKLFLFFALSFIINVSAVAQNWEINIVRNINPNYPHSKFWTGATSSAKAISIAAPVSMLAAGLITHNKDLQANSLETFGSLAIAIVATEGLKRTIDRKRHYQKYNDIYPNEIKDGESFPSGHASVAFSTATSLSLQYKKWYVVAPAFAWATTVGYSRLYLGQHYPTDIIASAVVGAGSALLSRRATQWLRKRK